MLLFFAVWCNFYMFLQLILGQLFLLFLPEFLDVIDCWYLFEKLFNLRIYIIDFAIYKKIVTFQCFLFITFLVKTSFFCIFLGRFVIFCHYFCKNSAIFFMLLLACHLTACNRQAWMITFMHTTSIVGKRAHTPFF